MLRTFVDRLCGGDVIEVIRRGVIGEGVQVPGPAGSNPLVYADYAASGRALTQVEHFVQTEVLPYYANAHTEASHCGSVMNKMRREARAAIAAVCNADDDCAVIFTGSGATSGINRLVHLLLNKDRATGAPLVLMGPYEHHSNILPWRESGAEIVQLPEAESGGPDVEALEETLKSAAPNRTIIAAFSAASNVTGIVSDVERITTLLKARGVISVWDYAGAGPYLPIDMACGIDAVVLSPHKFVGGPGASGVLIVRRSAVCTQTPSAPGGGTVSFVSPWAHHYADDVTAREEGGTPNVIGDIRAALALLIKARVGDAAIASAEEALNQRALEAWSKNQRLELLGRMDARRIPIFSFRVRDGAGGYIHHQLITRLLSDYYGVQARGGCACAGPYAHALLGLSRQASEALWARIEAGHELEKPGWTRVNLSYAMSEDSVERILDAVNDVAVRAGDLAGEYLCDERTARFRHRALT